MTAGIFLQRGTVFDIQHYAVYDGPGIRTTVFLKGCPLKCLWCCNPESQSFAPELRHTTLRCRSCFACEQACTKGAVRDINARPFFDREACRACNAPCVDVCPNGALAVVGEAMTADQVMTRVAADKAFYTNSGGGVTFSGGEPFAQPAFLEELLGRSKQLRIHTAVETCGHADPRAVARCEPLVDLFLYDLKVMDNESHLRLTGVSNAVILENLETVAARASGRLTVRVPVVPGCTDSPKNLEAISVFLHSLDIAKVQLMPYHALGSDKYASFGRKYNLAGTQCLAPHSIEEAARIFHASGVACEVGGE